MNIVAKSILSLVLQIVCITSVFAQLSCGQKNRTERKSIEYRVPQNSTIFKKSETSSFHPKAPFFRGEIIKPVKAVWYNPLTGSSVENPFMKGTFFYDTTGKLIKRMVEEFIGKTIEIISYNTFPNESYNPLEFGNYIDTLANYKSANMEPIDRSYYEYGIEQTEAPYITRVFQKWNKSKNRWDNTKKISYTYLDTISWYVIVQELYDSGPDNTFRLWHRETYSPIYDENNNISSVLCQATDYNLDITGKMLYEYYYPADAHDNMTGYDSLYYYWDGPDDTWIVRGKQTEFTWNRWNGFDYESNQMASFYGWYVSEDGEGWDLWGLQKYWYDMDGIAGSMTDTIYFYSPMYERWYTKAAETEIYNEQGDFCEDRYFEWKYLELTGGVLELRTYNIDSYLNEYNDNGLLWRYSNYYTGPPKYQDQLVGIWEVTEFADITNAISELPQSGKQSLTITPNPALGAVTISAADEISQIEIFDVVGRVVASLSPSEGGELSQTQENRQVTFDTGALPKGVYLVRALLKNGKIQTGKVVAR